MTEAIILLSGILILTKYSSTTICQKTVALTFFHHRPR